MSDQPKNSPQDQQNAPQVLSGLEPPAAAEAPPREDVPDALLQKALKIVQDAAHGNGLRGVQIAINDFAGEILHFEAWEIFKMDPQIAEKRVPGKQPGEVVGSQSELRSKITGLLQKITENPDVKKNTIDLLKKRPDLGFALKNQSITLEKFNRGFVVHELCPNCSGTKVLKCTTCYGDGKSPCPRCRGAMLADCPVCNGRGKTDPGNKKCVRCTGKGRVSCPICKGKGNVPCSVCKADGKVPCTNCRSTGWHTLSGFVTVRAKCGFRCDHLKKKPFFYQPPPTPPQPSDPKKPPPEFFRPVLTEEQYNNQKHERLDKAELHEDVPPLVEKYGPAMVTAHHADVNFIKEDVRLQELDRESRPDEFFVPYHLRLPFGTITFRLKDKIISGRLFGFNPVLLQMTPFLEEMLAEPIKKLEEAVRTKKNVPQVLKEVSCYRAIAQALRAAARFSHAKALEEMMAAYPVGFQQKTLNTLTAQADQALKAITGTRRHGGLIVGLAVCAGLFGAWHIGPLGAIVRDHLPDTLLVSAALDAALVTASGFLCRALIQSSAGNALREAAGHLFSPKERRALMPKAGWDGLWGFAGAALLCVAAIEAGAVLTGQAYPLWYEAFRSLAEF